MHYDGTATSSIRTIPTGTSVVNSTPADSVTTAVYLTANDPESGVPCIYIKGGFGLTCINSDSTSITIDGILKSQSHGVDLTNCCLREMRNCRGGFEQPHTMPRRGRTLSNGGAGLTGIIVNCKGVQDTVNLTVQF